MKKVKLYIFTVIALQLAFSLSAFSQYIIQGYVRSGPEGIGLNGITVSIKGSGTSTVTSGGSYSFNLSSISTVTLVANSVERVVVMHPGVNIVNFILDVVTDYDGNSYNAVEIGDPTHNENLKQVWLDENLKVTHFRDGMEIPYFPDNGWGDLRSPGYCWPNNGAISVYYYGPLYNWYTVNTGKLCPVGWHVPSDGEMERLTSNIGGLSLAGAKMKETGTLHWTSPNTGATNETNYTGLPGGFRSHVGWFSFVGESGTFWTSSETTLGSTTAYWYLLRVNQDALERRGSGDYESKEAGFSVRCLKDTMTTSPIIDITPNSAQSGGDLLINNGPNIEVKGVCWSTSSNPTVNDSHTERSTFPPGAGLGKFNAVLTELAPSTQYFVRAYATDESNKTIYGNEISFKTYDSNAITDYDGNYYNKVKIGSQVWLTENLKVTHYHDGANIPYYTDMMTWRGLLTPGYCWYLNDPSAFKDNYGALYNWYAVSTDKLCPNGWYVPTDQDWTILTSNFGGDNSAGGMLKESGFLHWLYPNTDANNNSGFSALPGGQRWGDDAAYQQMRQIGYWWTSTESNATEAWDRFMTETSGAVSRNDYRKNGGYSVRCIQHEIITLTGTITTNSAQYGGNIINEGGLSITSSGVCWGTSSGPTSSGNHTSDGSLSGTFMSTITGLIPDTRYYVRAYFTDGSEIVYGQEFSFKTFKSDAIYDIDGNYYNTIPIGGQIWMAENLKSTKLNDGTTITLETEDASWTSLTAPGYCWFGNDENPNKDVYGALYNYYSVNTGKLCPVGWHVPSDAEWTTLTDFLGGESVSGGKLKETGTAHWDQPNTGATDDKGFTALPGGQRIYNGIFNQIGIVGNWWTSTRDTYSWMRSISYNSSNVGRGGYQAMATGFSVRCVKDTNIIVVTRFEDDENPGSLRAAIKAANLTPVLDKIAFNIQGKGPYIIKLNSALPPITNYPIIIDGFTQPGSSAATSTILIELDGTNTGTGSNGLNISTSNCTIKGLVINSFSGNGIQVTGGTGNRISSNSIYNNSGLGIDLGADGVSPNNEVEDPNDSDSGPNNLQNFPVLDKTVFSLGEVYIDGHLNSMSGNKYTIEFFASKLADNTGYGEGQTYLGSAIVTTNAEGNASFTNKTFPYKTIYGDIITATATDPYGNTSEFSKAIGGLPDQEYNTNSFNYFINPNGLANADGTPKDTIQILYAVNEAFKTWTNIPTSSFEFNYQDETNEKYAHIDGRNLVSFSDDQYLFGDGVLAITAKTLKLGTTDTETQVMDADIIFNPYFAKHKTLNFGISDDMTNAGYFDIQSISTHEIGHILGLLHSGVHNSTMWFEMDRGIDARSLEQDDRSWASYKYPEPNNTFGSISGNIKYGYNDTKPIAGAMVLAINTTTRDTVHSYSDVNGNYLVPGLSDGSYYVYIEPLDGDVYGRPLYPRNISLYIYCNTTNFDYPGEFYSGNNENAQEANDLVTSVNVNPGLITPNIDFITNRDITPPSVVSVTPPDISISQDVIIQFSEPVKMGTLIKDNCYLIKLGETKLIGGSYTELKGETNAILFYPEEVLNYNTRYTLYITTGVTDLKGLALPETYKYSFKTGVGDKKAPTVIGIIPANGATGVFVNEEIVVTFSEAMDKNSVQSSFSIYPDFPDIGLTYSWDNENKTLTVKHSSSFAEGEVEYNIIVSTLAKDLSGNALESSVSASFITVLAAAPKINYLEPGNDPLLRTGVTVKTPIVAVFSEPINKSTISFGKLGTFRLLKGDFASGTDVNGTFEFLNQNSQVIFRPGTDLDFNQIYTIIITTGISDISQIPLPLENGKIVSFITEPKSSGPLISFIDPPSESVGAKVTIGGKGFDPNPAKNTVTFFNNVAATVTSASLTSLVVKVPVGAESGRVNVKVNGVLDDASSPYDFLVIQPYSDPCNEVIGNAQTGGNSRDVALDISGSKAYVTNSGSNNVSVINTKTLETEATISVGEFPLKIDINPEGTRAYVTNHGSRTVSVIDLLTYGVEEINVGINPYGVAVSPDGKRVYVANYSSPNISVIDVDPASGGFDHVTSNISTGTRNREVDIDPNSAMIVVTGDDGLKIIEIKKTEFGFDYATTNASSGTKTRDVEIITEAGLAVVSTMEGNLLFIGITPGTDTFGAVVANSSSGARAGDVKPDFSGVFLYVTNPYDDQVTVYKMTYGEGGSEIGSYSGFSIKEYWTIPVGISPQGLTINYENNSLFVANEFSETRSTGSVTEVKICCREKSTADDIVALTFYIKGMMGRNDIQGSLGNMLINKLNDAIINIAKGKTKLAINSMKAFINKVNELRSSGKVTNADAKVLIDAANAIIVKLQITTKSDTSESSSSDSEIDNLPEIITETKLGVIYPNPTKDAVTINYEIAENDQGSEKVTIQIYDVIGRLVGNLVNENQTPGRYSTSWKGYYDNGGQVPRGFYFIRFSAGSVREVQQIMLIR